MWFRWSTPQQRADPTIRPRPRRSDQPRGVPGVALAKADPGLQQKLLTPLTQALLERVANPLLRIG